MKPPLPFSNKGMLIILLVLLFMVGISSHPVQFLDPFGEVDLMNVRAGGGYELPPPHSGVTGFCGGCVWGWCGGTTLHTTLTHAHVHGKHVNQMCLHTRSFWGTCRGACGRVLGGNTSHPSQDTILTFGDVWVREFGRTRGLWGGWSHPPIQGNVGAGGRARASLARAQDIKGSVWEGVRSAGLTPLVPRPLLFCGGKVLVGVVSPTISNVLFSSCGVVVCVHTHNNTNSFSFIAALVGGGGGMGFGWGFGGKEWCGVGFVTHPHTLLFSYSFLLYLMWGVL